MPETKPRTTQMRDAAVAYAEAGVAVFPLHHPTAIGRCSCGEPTCTSQGKHPRTPNGVKDATDNADTVLNWWQRWPMANIGVAMTPDVFVVDIDPHNGGDETWLEVTADRSPIYTRTSLSGRGDGGRHLWLRHPGIKIMGSLGPGVDVKRVPNSYVVAPPSIHFATMKPYTWAADRSTPIAVPPTWLVDLLRWDPPARRSAGDQNRSPGPCAWSGGRWNPGGILHVMATATEGNRNKALYWCARHIAEDVKAGKAPERQALEALEMLAEIAERTGLPTDEVDKTIKSGYLA